MKIEKIGEKQLEILKFPYKKENYNALICDGAVRTGKTVFMIISFILWGMRKFDKSNFGICGKTVQSTERNIIDVVLDIELLQGLFKIKYLRSKHVLEVSGMGKKNKFYIFGGKDESSYTLIQGITLSGIFFDEVALQPRSFVEQGIARTLSVKESKLFFNCNPEHSKHWFKTEWIDDAEKDNLKNSYHLHFLMPDNPILDEEQIKKAETVYTGVFRDRYIYGLWVVAEGLVYPHFDNVRKFKEYKYKDRFYIQDENGKKFYGKYYISIDYGTSNPFSAGLWFVSDSFAVRVKEYYYNSRKNGKQKTDEEYFNELKKLAGVRPIEATIVDPSAASFIATCQRNNWNVRKANNNVIDGIRVVGSMLERKKIFINECCKDCIEEFSLYAWDEESSEDKVVKEHDHALDEVRYFAYTILKYKQGFYDEIEQTKVANAVGNFFDNF